MCKVIKDAGFFLYPHLNKPVLNKLLKKGIKEFLKKVLRSLRKICHFQIF